MSSQRTLLAVTAIGVGIGDQPGFYPVGSSRQFACLFNRTDTGANVGKVWGEVQATHVRQLRHHLDPPLFVRVHHRRHHCAASRGTLSIFCNSGMTVLGKGKDRKETG